MRALYLSPLLRSGDRETQPSCIRINAVGRACVSFGRNRKWGMRGRKGGRERERDRVLSNDAAGACICDVNSAVAASPDRPGATPPRTLSDYFTVNSPRERVLRRRLRVLRASHFSAATARRSAVLRFFKGDNHGRVPRESIAKDGIRYSRRRSGGVSLRKNRSRTRGGKETYRSH